MWETLWWERLLCWNELQSPPPSGPLSASSWEPAPAAWPSQVSLRDPALFLPWYHYPSLERKHSSSLKSWLFLSIDFALFLDLPLVPTLSQAGGSDCGESACSAGDPGLIPGSGRPPGEGNSNPLQCSCLENSTERGAWQSAVHGATKSQTQLSDSHCHSPTG